MRVLAEKMLEFGQQTGKVNFDRDGTNVADSDVVVLIGIKDAQPLGLNCGTCGVDICEMLPINRVEGEFRGPQCAYRLLDMGIALGSAVKTASISERRQPDHVPCWRCGASVGPDRGRLRHGYSAVSNREEHLL